MEAIYKDSRRSYSFATFLFCSRLDIARFGNGSGALMEQIVRNLTNGIDVFLNGKKFLLYDRDPLFTDRFR